MARAPGLSVRLKLTLSYAGFLVLSGALLLTLVWLFLRVPTLRAFGDFAPSQPILLREFVPAAAKVLALLLAVGLVGGWLLAGRVPPAMNRQPLE